MKLKELATKPQLTELTVDDPEVVNVYGEPLEFYIYDRQDMGTFMKLASLEDQNDFETVSEIVKSLVLDEEGNRILDDEHQLPVDVMIKVIETTVQELGKSVTQTSQT